MRISEVEMDTTMTDRVEKLVDFIMKNCLWQFHSRKWDRERQNREILNNVTEVLLGENTPPQDRLDRCHWVDAVLLARNYKKKFPWLNNLGKDEITNLMRGVRERMDYLTITGSLNQELTDEHY